MTSLCPQQLPIVLQPSTINLTFDNERVLYYYSISYQTELKLKKLICSLSLLTSKDIKTYIFCLFSPKNIQILSILIFLMMPFMYDLATLVC